MIRRIPCAKCKQAMEDRGCGPLCFTCRYGKKASESSEEARRALEEEERRLRARRDRGLRVVG